MMKLRQLARQRNQRRLVSALLSMADMTEQRGKFHFLTRNNFRLFIAAARLFIAAAQFDFV
jgi:hypothetical protein